ncbi:L-seryl-tRNA(Sec) selenium transferase [Brevibacterium sp.]|uniref:L-seryl-tRNA(Sec) selenium transferase n=1 Tax=Brevibacterium sp. TaxID=1701 RepID=UPI0025C57D84|nr:L-seryl-tRNA(Sec) selenium transferase [Brevibacterium sp.]
MDDAVHPLDDPRRRIPRTDALLAHPRVAAAVSSLSAGVVKKVIRAVQARARRGEIAPEAVVPELLASLDSRRPASLTPVLNATGVIVHTNLGRAPLSESARAAVAEASGYTDLEFDLATGARSRRGAGARSALLEACPAAEDALVVNNGAAALLLAATAFAGHSAGDLEAVSVPDGAPFAHAAEGMTPASRLHTRVSLQESGCVGERRVPTPPPAASSPPGPREILLSRGEFVEIGAGFRLSDLMESAGARIREVGTTNRTHLDDYARALTPATGCILKVHTSNFRVEGFTAEADLSALADLAHAHGVPLVVDLGSGLLEPEPLLPDEPDAATALAAGADVVIASGDKLLGGPQAGILLGRAPVIAALSRHPLARAVRADKLALAALEATLTAADAPVRSALHTDPDALRARTQRLAETLAQRLSAGPHAPAGQGTGAYVPVRQGTGAHGTHVLGADVQRAGAGATPQPQPAAPEADVPEQLTLAVVPHDGRVGGGGGTGVPLPGWALALPEAVAGPLRTGTPAVVGRVHEGRCLIDLRCVPEPEDAGLLAALAAALLELHASAGEAAAGPVHGSAGDGSAEP